LMARVKPHGSIATFYGVCLDPESPLCVVTEFVAGGNLHDFLKRCGHVSARDGVSLSRDLASGLQHLSETNILHWYACLQPFDPTTHLTPSKNFFPVTLRPETACWCHKYARCG
jgi:Protein tyrosine and serine/threonine kinase